MLKNGVRKKDLFFTGKKRSYASILLSLGRKKSSASSHRQKYDSSRQKRRKVSAPLCVRRKLLAKKREKGPLLEYEGKEMIRKGEGGAPSFLKGKGAGSLSSFYQISVKEKRNSLEEKEERPS